MEVLRHRLGVSLRAPGTKTGTRSERVGRQRPGRWRSAVSTAYQYSHIFRQAILSAGTLNSLSKKKTTSWQNAGRTTAHVCIGPIAPNMRRFSPGTAAPCGIRLGWPTRVASRERAPCWRGRWRGERLTSVALNLELVLVVLVILIVLIVLIVPDVLHVGGGGGQSRSWIERRHQGWSTRRLRRPCAARSEAMEHKLRGKVTLQWQTGE